MSPLISNSIAFLKNVWAGIKLIPSIRRTQVLHLFESFTRKDVIAVVILAVLCLGSGGFLVYGGTNEISSGEPANGGDLIEGLVGQPHYINPVLAPASSVDTDLSHLAFAQLLKFNNKLELIPDLAADLPTISADLKVYTLKLKSGLKWTDGKPILADDIVFTINLIQNVDFESPLRTNWSRVKVDKIDDLTVQLTLREVSASFITNFALAIIPKHIWEDATSNSFRLSDNNLRPVGSGPFAIREIKKTADGTIKSITFKANDNYYAGRPYLDRLMFKFYDDYEGLVSAYQAKEVSVLGYIPFDKKAFIEPSNNHNQFRINLPQYQAAFFNLQKSPIAQEKAVRQALWLATERDQIVDQVYLGFGKPAYGPILEGNLGYNPEIKVSTHTNLDEAAGILDKAGWVFDSQTNQRSKNKKPLEFTLATNNYVLNIKTAQILQAQWSRIGANVHLVIVSSQELDQQYIKPRNFDILLFSENTGPDPDPYAFWHSSQSRDPGLNLSGFSNAQADQLLTSARQTLDTNVRSQNYTQFQNIIASEIPAIFLDSAVYVYTVPKKVQGVSLDAIIHPSERFLDVRNWYIETQ